MLYIKVDTDIVSLSYISRIKKNYHLAFISNVRTTWVGCELGLCEFEQHFTHVSPDTAVDLLNDMWCFDYWKTEITVIIVAKHSNGF